MNMAKRFYKVNELIWLVKDKVKAKVVALDIPNLKATVTIKTEDGLQTRIVSFMDIDKLKTKTDIKGKKQRKKDTILFAKVKESAKVPSKREEDGAYDIYACFEEDELLIPKVTIQDDEIITIADHPLVPTGIASSVLSKYRINLKNERTSVAKYKVLVLAGLIDSGYRGEWFVNLAPLTKDLLISKTYPFPTKEDGVTQKPVETADRVIYPYSLAIAQAKIEISPNLNVKEITYDSLLAIPSARGTGAHGSSNK